MFLHVGNNKNIRMKDIVGIFDMDNATVSAVTRRYLTAKQRQMLVESAAEEELPKSFLVYREGDSMKICFSPLSSSALMGRMRADVGSHE